MKPKLLIGKPGIGKTYGIEKYAEENDFYLVEFNASDIRTADKLKDLSASQKFSVMGKRFLYLFDEVDSMDKGGSKVLSEFLSQAEIQKIPVFLIANNLRKVNKLIQNICEIEIVYPKESNEIKSILYEIFTDRMGFNQEIFNKIIDSAVQKCNGDIRKAIQYAMFSNTNQYEQEKLDGLKAIKMILYEKDRVNVFNYIRQIPISSLYSWLFETFATCQKKEIVKILKELNRSMYKVNTDYLYSFIAFALPYQTEKVMTRLPSNLNTLSIETKIIEKIRNTYKCSILEAKQYCALIKTMPVNGFHVKEIVKKCELNKKQLEFLGLPEEKIEKKACVQTASLLEY